MDNNSKYRTRKKLRMENFDYSTSAAYFITICSKERKPIFWDFNKIKDVEANCVRQNLSDIGRTVDAEIQKIDSVYDNVEINKYCIMPDHIHMIIFILGDENGRTQFAPTVSRVIKQFKGSITKQIGKSIWQRSFVDRVIRNEMGYQAAWKYIENNPRKLGE